LSFFVRLELFCAAIDFPSAGECFTMRWSRAARPSPLLAACQLILLLLIFLLCASRPPSLLADPGKYQNIRTQKKKANFLSIFSCVQIRDGEKREEGKPC
jgi:hypothetical protein